jgi:general secretion pathway protein N
MKSAATSGVTPAMTPTMTPAIRWAVAGALVGALGATVAFAPARWAAWALLQASQGRVVLGQAQGTVWSGQARITLTGGPGSRDALTLPGELAWNAGWIWDGKGPGLQAPALGLTLRHPDLMPAPLVMSLQPGLTSWSLRLDGASAPGTALRWPAAWLTALGTPWNTLQPSGQLRLSSPGFTLLMAPGGLRLQGSVVLEATDIASRLSTLPRLGSYRVVVAGTGNGREAATLQLNTLDGALLLSGSGQWTGARLRLRGEARAAPGQEAALQNLLNLIGTRDGARSVLSIG